MVRDWKCNYNCRCQAGKELSDEADFILASEVADAGCILLSHADEATAEEMDATVAHINEALEKIHCKRRIEKRFCVRVHHSLLRKIYTGL